MFYNVSIFGQAAQTYFYSDSQSSDIISASDIKKFNLKVYFRRKLPYLFGYKTRVSPLQNDYK